ncbi:MAG: PVC-type heme-binding CxxCH protein [Planctomycetaceae bacterium]
MRRRFARHCSALLAALIATSGIGFSEPALFSQDAKKPVIPHAQDKAPNEPRDPQTAAKMMTVPEGFSVEVVAAEPDIVNPVAMAIDERGRFWITESLEYPRKSAGPGKDRVKILEDTDGDGKCDKFTVFLDGLNIPSGIAVGHGGVWIANAPDILFVPDADRDGVPDGPPQVVVTGFGRTDTHELPNSLTWGPDGWLYGLNGVFNFSKVTYPPDSPWLKHVAHAARVRGGEQSEPPEKNKKEDKNTGTRAAYPTEFTFTCAMFRIHPRTREFQVFAEGTSNPWGIAFNDEGEAFVSACVIDHLWHIVETGYYHRQGGPYPPFTWKIDSIVKHKHQKAAYCGIHYFDSDAYPEQYRGKLYMGNIHGGCINVDKLQRDGSTYFATGEPDFLTANDAWFMPVVQKTGPDGCLYILDWYDRYHCYQDANRDPAGIDRLKGRLYRVRYNGKGERGDVSPPSPPAKSADAKKEDSLGEKKKDSAARKKENSADLRQAARLYPQMDLAKETDEQLIERLGANNDFIRWTATRLLQERDPTPKKLLSVMANRETPREQKLFALFVYMGSPSANFVGLIDNVDITLDSNFLAWANRMAGNYRVLASRLKDKDWTKEGENVPANVRLQLTIGLSKLPTSSKLFEGLLWNLSRAGDDPLIPRITWQTLHPRLETDAQTLIQLLASSSYLKSKPVADLMPRVADRILGRQKFDAQPIAKLFALLRDDHPQVGRQVLEIISAKVQSGELKGEKLDQLKAALAEPLTPLLTRSSGGSPEIHPLANDAALLAVSWGDPRGLPQVRRSFATAGPQVDLRMKALNALIAAKDAGLLESVAKVLDDTCEEIANCKLQIANLKLKKEDSQPIANLQSAICNLQSQLLPILGRLDDPKVADVVLTRYANLEPELQPSAIELLTQRASWSKQLLSQVGEKKIAATAINVNQARRIQALKDKELNDLLSRHWGQVRDTRNPDREKVVAEMKSLIRQKPGDPFAGEKVFKRVCAACHKIYGEGPDIGPDITSNGRNDFNQLLSNVFDPSLVIGAGYRVCTVVNKAGRVQSGLLVEDSPQRVVLKPASVVGYASRGADSPTTQQPVTVAVGKLEIIPREDIDEFKINELSLMPEGLEKQLTPQEITDLFAFLTLDKHPNDKSAKRLPGVSAITPRDSTNPAEFPSLIAEVLPGFTTTAVGEGGVALLNNHFGRDSVLRTHPISRDTPCVLTQKLTPPAGKKTTLVLDVSHDPRGDWRLVIRGNGERLADEMISKETCSNGWRKLTVDLSKFAGQELTLGLVNQANDWSFEFGYWGSARLVSE